MTFERFNLNEKTIQALDKLGYTEPTDVQKEAILPILKGRDVLIKSQTGSGKTASFGIPIIDKTDWDIRTPQTIVLTPTRELALQVRDELSNIGRYHRLNVQAVYGKDSFKLQKRDLSQRTHIVVATPGRLYDHLTQDTIDVSKVKTLVIDEADEMLSMGFIEQIEDILSFMPERIQVILLSATFPEEIKKLSEEVLRGPIEINVVSTNNVGNRIIQESYRTTSEEKLALLHEVLIVKNPDHGIIFANTKEAVNNIEAYLSEFGANIRKLHGDMDQKDRTQTIHDFKTGKFRFLVATDVASRGLDIHDVSIIINYDTPHHLETYTHRIGRTARLDKEGLAVSLLDDDDAYWIGSNGISEVYEITAMKKPSESLVEARQELFLKKQNRKQKPRETQEAVFKEDIMKLHIRGGKNNKIRPGDIVGVITSISGITFEDIGVIQVLEDSTYVDIHNGKGNTVLKYLQNHPIKGKQRRVGKAYNDVMR